MIPYSAELELKTGKLDFIECPIKNSDQQLIRYRNINKLELIMKRKTEIFNIGLDINKPNSSKIFENHQIKLFMNNCLKEYFISRLAYAHPSGVFAYDFHFTYLLSQQILVFELLMEDAGKSLQKIYKEGKLNTLNFVKVFSQLISVMEFLEYIKIFYSDVKLDNFLIDSRGLFRVIDYDVSQDAGYGKTRTMKDSTNMLGYTEGYVAPEVKAFIKKQVNKELKPWDCINIWKGDIYSCGILGLLLGGAIKDDQTLKNLDGFKDTLNNHENIIKLIDKINVNDSLLTAKMKCILEACLDFDPERRLSFKHLNDLMKIVNLKSLDEIKKSIQKYSNISESPLKSIWGTSQDMENSGKKNDSSPKMDGIKKENNYNNPLFNPQFKISRICSN